MSHSDRVKEILATVLQKPVDQINDDSSSSSIPEWDSLNHMKIVLALEEEFDIRIEDDQIGQLLSFLSILKEVALATDGNG